MGSDGIRVLILGVRNALPLTLTGFQLPKAIQADGNTHCSYNLLIYKLQSVVQREIALAVKRHSLSLHRKALHKFLLWAGWDVPNYSLAIACQNSQHVLILGQPKPPLWHVAFTSYTDAQGTLWHQVHDTLGLCWHTTNPLAFLAEALSLSFRVFSQHARCCLVSIETWIPASWVKVECVSLHRAPTSIPLGTFLFWKSLVCISSTHLILADGFTWLVHTTHSTLVSSFLMPKGNLWVKQ